MEQRLSRYAAPVQARPAEVLLLLHERHAHPKLARPDRGYVPAVAAADDHHVELVVFCHPTSPLSIPDLVLTIVPLRASLHAGKRDRSASGVLRLSPERPCLRNP